MTEFARRLFPRLAAVAFAALWCWAVYSGHANLNYNTGAAYANGPAASVYVGPDSDGFVTAGYGCEWNSRYGLGCFRQG
jgi:hypothetical protein